MGRENLEIKSVMKHHALFIQTFAMFGVVVNILEKKLKIFNPSI
ncbi:hypothetical protein M214_1259 [Acinetobacter baumannii CI86]|nr:hypothetical protein M214_1259 [Acinetobacter baumannii CI86]ETR89606.1 hypothetical protein M212_1332 [Acinetobacter baumannii CI79]